MFEYLFGKVEKELSVIKGAPVAFVLLAVIIGFALFFVLEWFHGEKTAAQDQHIALLTDQKGQLERQIVEQKETVSAVMADSAEAIADSAELSILFWGNGHRAPAPVSEDNIWRWHIFFTGGDDEWMAKKVTVLIVFNPRIQGKKISITSPDFEIPPYRILEFNYRYAIIEFTKNFPKGTLAVNSR